MASSGGAQLPRRDVDGFVSATVAPHLNAASTGRDTLGVIVHRERMTASGLRLQEVTMKSLGKHSSSAVAFFALCLGNVGCSDSTETPLGDEILGASVEQPIVGGTSASAYAEAALVNGPGFFCSGAVIAPRVVLTAGHCVVGASSWTVVAPFAGNQSAHGSKSWTDYVSAGEQVNRNSLDVAVIILDKAITLSSYPTLGSTVVPVGTRAVNVGRIRNGQISNSTLYVGGPITLQSGATIGFPKSYVSKEVIESGDSGGPVFVGSGASRTIVGVNSGAGGGTQVLARVDLAYAQIQSLIAANGGNGGSSSGGSSSGGSSSGGSSSGSSACAGTPEAEPNDSQPSANPLSGTRCGSLASGGDVDWYSWSVDKAGVSYDVTLTASSDADLLMWKSTGFGWSRISSTSPTRIAAISSGAGTYAIAIRSAGSVSQSYSLELVK